MNKLTVKLFFAKSTSKGAFYYKSRELVVICARQSLGGQKPFVSEIGIF